MALASCPGPPGAAAESAQDAPGLELGVGAFPGRPWPGMCSGWRPSAKRACRCTQPAPVRHMTRCVSPASWGGSTPTTGNQSHAGSRGRRGPGHRRVRLRRDPGRGPRRHPRLPVPVRLLAPARATHSHPAVCRPSHSARVTAARGRLSPRPSHRRAAPRHLTRPVRRTGRKHQWHHHWVVRMHKARQSYPGGKSDSQAGFRERWLGTLISAGRAWRFTGSDLGDRGLR
jgi:hypothetical protein